MLLKADPGFAPLLHLALNGHCRTLVAEEGFELAGHSGQALADAMSPQTRLPAQLLLGRRRVGGRLRGVIPLV